VSFPLLGESQLSQRRRRRRQRRRRGEVGEGSGEAKTFASLSGHKVGAAAAAAATVAQEFELLQLFTYNIAGKRLLLLGSFLALAQQKAVPSDTEKMASLSRTNEPEREREGEDEIENGRD